MAAGEAGVCAADQTEEQGWDARALPVSSASPLDRKRFPLSSSALERAGAGGQNPWRRHGLACLGARRGRLAPDSESKARSSP